MRLLLFVPIFVACSSGGAPQPPARPLPATPPVAKPAAETVLPVEQRAPDVLARDCAGTDYAACTELAKRYTDAIELDLDYEKAAELRGRACTHGDLPACTALGNQLWYGDGVDQNEPRALELWQRACDGGEPAGCEGVARNGRGDRKALHERAYTLYLERCTAGDDHACFGAHSIHYNRNVATPVAQAVWDALRERAEPSCTSGSEPERCWVLWRMASDGLGVTQDAALAVRYAVRACELKHAQLCGMAARAYEEGRGVSKDAARATAFHQRGCELGNRYDCYFLATKETDPERKREYMRRSCEAGDVVKCADLAAELDDTDPMTATRYRERACRRGWSHSCLDRGNELLAEKRRADAMPWFERACRDRQTIEGCVAVATELDRACDAGAASECTALDAFLAKLPTNRRVAVMYDCCADRPELRSTPGGALLLFFDAVERKDLAAVRTFVHPKHPIHVRIGWHGEDGSSEDTFQFRAKDTSLTRLSEVAKPPASSLECGDVTADGPARCGAWGGGYGASFELLRERGRFYVTSLDEEGH